MLRKLKFFTGIKVSITDFLDAVANDEIAIVKKFIKENENCKPVDLNTDILMSIVIAITLTKGKTEAVNLVTSMCLTWENNEKALASGAISSTSSASEAAALPPMTSDHFLNAAQYGYLESITRYIRENHDNKLLMNVTDKHGSTALMLAITNNHLAIVSALLDAKADVNAFNHDCKTPLMCATNTGNITILKALVAEGAEINATDRSGDTALTLAIKAGKADVVKTLLAFPNIDLTTRVEKKSLSELAKRYHQHDIATLINDAIKSRKEIAVTNTIATNSPSDTAPDAKPSGLQSSSRLFDRKQPPAESTSTEITTSVRP